MSVRGSVGTTKCLAASFLFGRLFSWAQWGRRDHSCSPQRLGSVTEELAAQHVALAVQLGFHLLELVQAANDFRCTGHGLGRNQS